MPSSSTRDSAGDRLGEVGAFFVHTFTRWTASRVSPASVPTDSVKTVSSVSGTSSGEPLGCSNAGLLYEAGEFLSVHEYAHVRRWTDEIAARRRGAARKTPPATGAAPATTVARQGSTAASSPASAAETDPKPTVQRQVIQRQQPRKNSRAARKQ